MKLYIALCFAVWLGNINADQIKIKFHPAPEDPNYPNGRMIWFNRSTYDQWSHKLDNFLEIYRTPELTEKREENLMKCSHNKPPKDDSVCYVNVKAFSPCIASNYFGYRKAKPCVFFELEKISGWKPHYFNNTKILPKGMPQTLKDQIEELTIDPDMWSTVWFSCDGETAADKELIGPVSYMPYPGFSGYFFPYTGQPGYLGPLVAIQFQQPARGVVINIECKAWAPGILHNYNKELGMVRFELLIDF